MLLSPAGTSSIKKAQQAKPYLFDTEMSHVDELPAEDKELSPWVRKNTLKCVDTHSKQAEYHSFLAQIKHSPRLKAKKSISNNPEDKTQIQYLRADLINKIKAERIQGEDYIQLIYNHSHKKQIDEKSCFMKKGNLKNVYKKPKAIQLSLDWNDEKGLRGVTCFSTVTPISQNYQQKKQTQPIRKLKKKKESSKSNIFAETMKDFRVNILSTQKKFYKTLELHINPASKTTRKTHFGDSDMKCNNRNNGFLTRPRFTQSKLEKMSEEQEASGIQCQGKNLLLFGAHRSRRDKIKYTHLSSGKQYCEDIFLK